MILKMNQNTYRISFELTELSGPYCINQLSRTLVTMAVLLKHITLINICLIQLFFFISILFEHDSLDLLFMSIIFLNQDSLICLLILSFSVTVTFNINWLYLTVTKHQFSSYQLQSLPTGTRYLLDALSLRQKPGQTSNSRCR